MYVIISLTSIKSACTRLKLLFLFIYSIIRILNKNKIYRSHFFMCTHALSVYKFISTKLSAFHCTTFLYLLIFAHLVPLNDGKTNSNFTKDFIHNFYSQIRMLLKLFSGRLKYSLNLGDVYSEFCRKQRIPIEFIIVKWHLKFVEFDCISRQMYLLNAHAIARFIQMLNVHLFIDREWMWEREWNHMTNYKNKQIKIWLISKKSMERRKFVLCLLLLLFFCFCPPTNIYTIIKYSLWASIGWQQYVTASICFSTLNDSISKQQFMCIFIVSHVYNRRFVETPSWRIRTKRCRCVCLCRTFWCTHMAIYTIEMNSFMDYIIFRY